MVRFRLVYPQALRIIVIGLVVAGCASVPVKRYYVMKYIPEPPAQRQYSGSYPCVIRLKELDIEKAYDKLPIVYRQSPYELRYYGFKFWAVKPSRMITDLLHRHLLSINFARSIVRRFDEAGRPDYELSGLIDAIEEYDSEDTWFAHLSMRFRFTRLSDGRVVYTRHFDHRKRVFRNDPEYVVKELSAIAELIINQVVRDLDAVLADEFGFGATQTQAFPADTAVPPSPEADTLPTPRQ